MLALLLIFLQLPNLAMILYLAAIFRRPQNYKDWIIVSGIRSNALMITYKNWYTIYISAKSHLFESIGSQKEGLHFGNLPGHSLAILHTSMSSDRPYVLDILYCCRSWVKKRVLAFTDRPIAIVLSYNNNKNFLSSYKERGSKMHE